MKNQWIKKHDLPFSERVKGSPIPQFKQPKKIKINRERLKKVRQGVNEFRELWEKLEEDYEKTKKRGV